MESSQSVLHPRSPKASGRVRAHQSVTFRAGARPRSNGQQQTANSPLACTVLALSMRPMSARRNPCRPPKRKPAIFLRAQPPRSSRDRGIPPKSASSRSQLQSVFSLASDGADTPLSLSSRTPLSSCAPHRESPPPASQSSCHFTVSYSCCRAARAGRRVVADLARRATSIVLPSSRYPVA
ncbi:hypothetical protein CC78DRAFT_578998 [Lojkania enalia]|uniref:Uncharacterized protein n=1 Tax=Lojkania enalia TaxID=147567 RepID=A0A9P4N8P2_9PLEO|nr:hypothetical protein CC78DRAFT_578998 [Didymosphaeria enalia]